MAPFYKDGTIKMLQFYNDGTLKWWPISGKPRLVKYSNLARWLGSSSKSPSFFEGLTSMLRLRRDGFAFFCVKFCKTWTCVVFFWVCKNKFVQNFRRRVAIFSAQKCCSLSFSFFFSEWGIRLRFQEALDDNF